MQSGTVSVEDSGNQQEETDDEADDETETTEADVFDAKGDTEAENMLETQYSSSTHDEKSSPSSSGGNTLLLPTVLPNQTLTTKSKNNLSIHKTRPIRGKTFQKKALQKKVWSKKDGPKTPMQQDIRNAMKPDTPKRKEMASFP